MESPTIGPYTLQAVIAAVHADAATPAETDWQQIVELYDALLQVHPSPVVALNRAVAVAMRDGPEAGLAMIDDILANGDLADYHLAHAARATCAAGWGEPPRPVSRTNGLLTWPLRNRNAVSSINAYGNWTKKIPFPMSNSAEHRTPIEQMRRVQT